MQDFKQSSQLKWWPSPQDYNEAVQNPLANLAAEDLRRSSVAVDALGLPRPMSGAFASVYRMHRKSGESVALRCFLRNVADQEQRYKLVSEFVESDDLPYTVSFRYYDRGIRVNGDWFPALKMDWVEGDPLDTFVRNNIQKPHVLNDLAQKFLTMCDDLRRAGIAHGDLQHGNVLVYNGELRLVDYDGMYVPSMTGFSANELGHPNYQHPTRNAGHFGPYLDNFSAWLIYASIKALALDPSLFTKLAAADDCLIFRRDDLADPTFSFAFHTLESHSNAEIRTMARFVRAQLKIDPADVPALGATFPEVSKLEPTRYSAAAKSQNKQLKNKAPSGFSTVLPDWLSSMPGFGSNPAASVRAQVQAQGAPQPQLNMPTFPGMPPELMQPRPRQYTYNKNCKRVQPKWKQLWILANPLVFLLCLGCIISAVDNSNLIKYGTDVEGKIANIEHVSGKSSYYSIIYMFQTPDKALHTGAGRVPESDGLAVHIGSPVHVRALLSKPEVSVAALDGGRNTVGYAQHEFMKDLMGGLFVWAVMIWLMLWIWWNPGKDRWLVQRGRPAPGTVTRLETVSGSKGAKYYYIHYRYRARGGDIQGRQVVSKRDYDRFSQGQRVVVLYDEKNPTFSRLYDISYYVAKHP